ncbi:MAG: lipid-A-disaccharide synthase [Muribaculaceae bacterium]|nr:lipid-A-disaccharide synthase [Muribaculaceae bacterium]
MKYMIVAGEASGDLHASQLIKALKEADPDFDVRYFGGDLMEKESRRRPDLHYKEMNVMGFSEVLRKLPSLWRNLKQAKLLIDVYRPDALILVDYPGFNLKLAKYASKKGIPVHYFISPKVWAWKEYRVKRIKKYVDKLYSILPFEVPFYKKHGYEVTYVGNPSVQEIAHSMKHIPPRRHFQERQGLSDEKPIIALLPGSRKGEIRNNLPLMIEAVKRFPDFQYVVGAAPSIPEKFYREVAQDPGLKVVFGVTHTLLKYSQAAVVTSGTATLETALIGTPQVVAYRANGMKLSYKIMEKLLKVKYVSLPNLIVNNNVVPELLVHNCTADAIARELTPLLQPSPRRDWQIAGYRNMQRRLGNYVASEYVAELILDSLTDGKPLVEKPAPSGMELQGEGDVAAPPRKKKKRKKKKKPAVATEEGEQTNQPGLNESEASKQEESVKDAGTLDNTDNTESSDVAAPRPKRRRKKRNPAEIKEE